MEDNLAWDIPAVRREALAQGSGLRYLDFRATLTPRYGLAWTLLLAGHSCVALIFAAMAWTCRRGAPAWISVPLGALAFGYALAYIQLFFHEAAHYNLAKRRGLNDALANVFIGSLTGQDIRRYRDIHFEHHRRLGTTGDTEISYYDPLDMRFLLEGLAGIKLATVFALRDAHLRRQGGGGYATRQLAVGILLNLAVILGWLHAGLPEGAAAWAAGLILVYPFLNALRVLLEHRGEDARPGTDYRRVDHGAVNRLFGNGPLSDTFGGAGFNRHLLHHWEPQVPFTRLGELEAFLMRTDVVQYLRSRQTSYPRIFARLWGWGA